MLRRLGTRLDFFDGALHLLGSGDVYLRSTNELSDLRGALAEADVCSKCVNTIGYAVRTRLQEAGMGIVSDLPMSYLRDGEIVMWDRGGFRDVRASDRCVWRPVQDIGSPPDTVRELSALEQLVLIDSWGLDRCCCEELIRWAARGSDRSQRQVPVMLADPDAGKTTLIDALKWGLPPDACYGITGQIPDRFATLKVMLSAFVFVDEAQDLKAEGFSVLKGATGGASAGLRSIRFVGDSRASRSSIMLLSERGRLQFGTHWHGGWMSRARFFASRIERDLGESGRNQVLEPDALRYLRWRVLLADRDLRFTECTHLQDARHEVTQAMNTKEKRLG